MKTNTQFIKDTVHYVLAEQLSRRTLSPEAVVDLTLQLVLMLTAANDNDTPATFGDIPLSAWVPGLSELLVPAVPIDDSIHDEYIVCLEDGLRFSMMKRHLTETYGMTPDQYRNRWGLPRDYPMTAPAYSRRKSEAARKLKLGRYPRR